MTYELALENVKADRVEAVKYIKQHLRCEDSHNAEHLSDASLAELYADAYRCSEWGL